MESLRVTVIQLRFGYNYCSPHTISLSDSMSTRFHLFSTLLHFHHIPGPSIPPVPNPPTNPLAARLDEAWPADRARLRSRLRRFEGTHKNTAPNAQALTQIERDLTDSARLWAQRRSAVPEKIKFPADLPITAARDDIAEAIRDNQVVVLCGETGSGKTTQLPKICLELGYGVDRRIGHTQPRRLAARSVADRLAQELGVQVGRQVGAKVRFDDKTSPQTLIKLMTDGMLLAETQTDRFLNQYDCLIIDEAHERSLNIDFLLGYLRQLLPKRPDLKLIITSATIDPDRFAQQFARPHASGHVLPAPIIMVPGRTYAVQTRYRPLVEETRSTDSRREAEALSDAVLLALDELAHEHPRGDVLVFMPGEREIRQTARFLRESLPPTDRTEILPLYARLSPAEQQRIFKTSPHRRVIIATNVAETSLTVPGILGVIDPGTARISRYSARSKVQGLPIEPISRASADQRKGRCGRIAPGTCIRLYSVEDFNNREEFTPPEILRTNLAAVILQMEALKLGRPEDFPFLDPPDSRMIRDGYQTLEELGALTIHEDGTTALTDLGTKLARLPVDPRIGRMILAAQTENCLHDVLVIASALSAPDPRDRPADNPGAADEAHEKFTHPESDFLSYLAIWDFYHDQRAKHSRSKLEKSCKQNFLNTRRIHEWREIHRQIHGLVLEMGFRPHRDYASKDVKHAPYDAIHRALLAGLVTNVGKKGDGFDYKGCRNTTFNIHPGSGQFNAKPKWILAGELVRTTKLYARSVARVSPEWIEQVAPHLLIRSYADARWDTRSARVLANEKVALAGLEIIPKRSVHFGPIDPAASRELFIHHALIEGELDSNAKALVANRDLIARIEAMQAKARRTDLLASSKVQFDFYDKRLPADVFSGQSFHAWLRRSERDNPSLIRMHEADLLAGEPEGIDETRFPDHYQTLSAPLPLEYAFAPNADTDGVTLRVPVELLGQIRPETADRLVPGLLAEKIAALVKTLPKRLRRNFDADSVAAEVAPQIADSSRPLVQGLAEQLSRHCGAPISPGDFKPAELDKHLHLRFLVIDEHGDELGASRDLAELRAQFADKISGSVMAAAPGKLDRTDLTDWDFGDLPESIEIERAGPGGQAASGVTVTAYPALVDKGDTCDLKLFDTTQGAAVAMRAGLARLYVRNLRDEFKYRVEHLPGIGRLRMLYSPLGPSAELDRDLMLLIADRVFVNDKLGIRTREQFADRIKAGWNRLTPCTDEVATLLEQILSRRQEATQLLNNPNPPGDWRLAIADSTTQLNAMCAAGFLGSTPYAWLRCLPRFLAGITKRFEKLRTQGADRDRQYTAQVHEWTRKYDTRATEHRAQGIVDPELTEFRWLTEELRVSLFAQELGTSVKVSPTRLQKHWDKVRV
ncbi:MAG: ATP-dependent helicase HrpA [Phycisphaerales bacterium]|jgi:ATP-dependent helicase HrpA